MSKPTKWCHGEMTCTCGDTVAHQDYIDLAELERKAFEEDGFITFPDFYMFRNESGWRWVSRDATKSSPAAFEHAPTCMIDARHTLDRAANHKAA